ncbi:MAG: polyprenyl synthetase family protein [Candidatus Ancaeobacter aquaticus]|nr:polyprenyl synthetase family protein [Candidatus Ancaeobacter aquaticus]
MNLKKYLETRKSIVDKHLHTLMPLKSVRPKLIHEATRYGLFNGGKRIRPILTCASCEAVSGKYKQALDYACGIELIHTYSLIHDDLPCMDNDDFRRGKPTTHKVYGDAIAVLTGDALLTRAFQIFARNPKIGGAQLIEKIAHAAGSHGLIGGQVIDLESEGKRVTAKTLEYIHRHKTGSLISVAIEAGALIGKASRKQLFALKTFGDNIGLTFQISDDILDITGTKEKLGKGIGKDIAQKKATYPALYGMEKTKRLLVNKTQEALDALSTFDKKADPLREIARFIAQRDR